jgi:hypothetical protein
MLEVVSVHFPKAGGTSLGNLFRQWYGTAAVRDEAVDDPVDPCARINLDPHGYLSQTERLDLDPTVAVVHGHFHPSKYRSAEKACWITFLRHPIDNLVSIHFFWKKYPRAHGLHAYFLDQELDLLQTARLPSLRHLMTRVYFRDVDMARFDFVGLQEDFEKDCLGVADLLGKPRTPPERANPNAFPGYIEHKERIANDRRLMGELESLLRDDIDFYERHARR